MNTSSEHNARGIHCSKAGDKEAAITEFSQAIQLDRQCAEAYFNRAVAYHETARSQCALQDLSTAIAIDPQLSIAYYCRAVVAIQIGDRLDRAERDLAWFIQNNPRISEGYNQRYLLRLTQGRLPEALTDAQACTNVAPESPLGYMNQYEVYMRLNRLEKAFEMVDQAVQLAQFSGGFRNRGVLHFLLGHDADLITADLKEASLLYHHEGRYVERDEMTRMLMHYAERRELFTFHQPIAKSPE